jgi:hypothetical protein
MNYNIRKVEERITKWFRKQPRPEASEYELNVRKRFCPFDSVYPPLLIVHIRIISTINAKGKAKGAPDKNEQLSTIK